MTYQEIIEKYLKEGYIGENNTCNGKCTKCGECCGTVLPLSQEDVDQIVEYVFKNNIYINKYMLVMRNKMQCPYYRGGEKGCSIYEARPKICRFYKCDKKSISANEMKEMGVTYPVDMWALAEDIEKEMKKYAANKKTRKATSKSI